MSTSWRNKYFERVDCQGIAVNEGTGDILVQGEINSNIPDPIIVFWAANPPTYTQSFSGSALPYHDSVQAFDRTPNIGAVKAVNRKFEFRIKYPNAYYVGLGSLYVPPHVHFKICESKDIDIDKLRATGDYHTIQIDDGIPFRSLTHPSPPGNNPRTGPMFYHCNKDKLQVRTQEQILRDSGYPDENVMPNDFWGFKPGN